MGGVIRDKVHEVGRGQIMKTFLPQPKYLSLAPEAVKDLTYASTINRMVLIRTGNPWFIMENSL